MLVFPFSSNQVHFEKLFLSVLVVISMNSLCQADYLHVLGLSQGKKWAENSWRHLRPSCQMLLLQSEGGKVAIFCLTSSYIELQKSLCFNLFSFFSSLNFVFFSFLQRHFGTKKYRIIFITHAVKIPHISMPRWRYFSMRTVKFNAVYQRFPLKITSQSKNTAVIQ